MSAPPAPRFALVATCALAVIGGYFLVLRVAWLAEIDTEWLPYVAHALAAMLAGAAVVRAAPDTSPKDACAGGVLGIVLLGAVAFGIPDAFGWFPARSGQPWLLAALIAAASGVACGACAWLFRRDDAARAMLAIVAVAFMTTACTVLLGGRVAYALGMSIDQMSLLLVSCVAAFLAAFATQLAVAQRSIGASSAGIPMLVALVLLEGAAGFQGGDLQMLVAWVAGLIGAHIAATILAARTRRPHLPVATANRP